jgi:primary-amine oxidase
VFAHGDEAHMVPMDKTLQAFGADVQWDDYAQMFTLMKDGAYVKVKPGAKTAIVNGKSLDLQVPVVMKDGKAWVSDTFINDVFQSGLDQTFQVEKRPHPLNSLSAAEISEAVTIVKASPQFRPIPVLPKSPCTSRIKRRCGPSRLKEPPLRPAHR